MTRTFGDPVRAWAATLVAAFPQGSAARVIEQRRRQAGAMAATNVIRALADELLAQRGFRRQTSESRRQSVDSGAVGRSQPPSVGDAGRSDTECAD